MRLVAAGAGAHFQKRFLPSFGPLASWPAHAVLRQDSSLALLGGAQALLAISRMSARRSFHSSHASLIVTRECLPG